MIEMNIPVDDVVYLTVDFLIGTGFDDDHLLDIMKLKEKL